VIPMLTTQSGLSLVFGRNHLNVYTTACGPLLILVSKKDGMLNTWDEPTWGGLPYASTGIIEDIFRTVHPSDKGGWRRYD
jgi:hypothetical protein